MLVAGPSWGRFWRFEVRCRVMPARPGRVRAADLRDQVGDGEPTIGMASMWLAVFVGDRLGWRWRS
jgi:hypothetical protein